ncbi:hypothetical protein Salat_0398000 [Sesamum alatum]|uniref:Uncharacterized protein n=1 Tax=Sesamum alatum TaxID=300844 RepID=A0AAE2CZT9_9LAMI|nr:hypothetical protein Salat_0398000 [Sesamum alatum]
MGFLLGPIKTTRNFWTLVTKRIRKPDAPGQAPGFFQPLLHCLQLRPFHYSSPAAGRSFSPGFSPLARRMSEPPFRPREKLVEKQKFFQSIHKHTYLKGPYDKITSVAIPLALAGSSLYMIGKGIYNMSHGIGKKE